MSGVQPGRRFRRREARGRPPESINNSRRIELAVQDAAGIGWRVAAHRQAVEISLRLPRLMPERFVSSAGQETSL